MANIGAFLVIIAVSASTVYAYPQYPDKPSTSASRFPNILAPLKSLFSKREPHQYQQHHKEQVAPVPVAIPVQFVPQPDMSGAESGASSEFNLTPRPIPIPVEADLNQFDSASAASPSPQFSLGRPMRITMRNPFRRPRRPRPVMQGGPQQGFQQGFPQEDQPAIGSAGSGGARPHNPYGYPVEHNTEEQFNNNIDDGKPRPAYGHYGNRGPEVGQSFQQPQQQFPASYGGSPARRPMRSRPFYSGGGSNNNNAGPSNNGVFPYPSVVRGSGARKKPFRPSRPDASYEDGNQYGGGGGFGQGGFGGGNPDFQQAEEVVYGKGSGGRGSRPYRQQPFSNANSEPEIITLNDLQNQGYGGQGFDGDDQSYQYEAGRPVRGGRYPMKLNQGSSNSYTRPVPSYSLPQHEDVVVHRRPKGGRIYQSRPLRSPGGRLNPYSHFASNSDEVPSYKNPKPVPLSVESNEEILYGKPMAMSSTTHASSSTGKELPTSTYRPTEHSSQRPVSTRNKPPYIKPYLLKATKNPNYKKSSTISNPVIIDTGTTGELQQSATSFGGGGDADIGSELQGGNGDRILFHVSGHKGPYSYRWGYDTGKGYNRMFRFEEKDESGHVRGKYGYQDKHGKMNVVNYEAHPDAGYHQEPTNY